jgi:hypothetical protein
MEAVGVQYHMQCIGRLASVPRPLVTGVCATGTARRQEIMTTSQQNERFIDIA